MHNLSRTILLILVLILVTTGLVMLYSTTYARSGMSQLALQCIWLVAAITAATVLSRTDYHFLCKYAWFFLLLAWVPLLYLAGVHLLAKAHCPAGILNVVACLTDEVKGAYRWLKFGPIRIQPSEFVKICLILFLAYYFGRNTRHLQLPDRRGTFAWWDFPGRIRQLAKDAWRGSLIPLIIGAVVALSVMMGGSVSVAVITVGVVFTVAFVAGVPLRVFGWIAIWPFLFVFLIAPWLVFTSSLPEHHEAAPPPPITTTASPHAPVTITAEPEGASAKLIKGVLGDARSRRVFSWLDPEEQAKTVVSEDGKKSGGGGYQLWMSMLALGSGSWTGLGFTESRMKKFYLPEAHTDFIVAVIGEELGFLAVFLLILCYILLVGTCFWMAALAADKEGTLICAGIGASFGLHAFFNIAVVSGFIPTTGITAPFVSYGGSNLLASGIGVGLLLSVSRFAQRAESKRLFVEPEPLPER